MKKPRHQWTGGQLAALIELYPHIPTEWFAQVAGIPLGQVYAKAGHLGLVKTERYMSSEFACRLRRGDNVGAGTRFKKGHETWNKGMKGLDLGGKETQFKPGQKPHNTKPIGSARLSKEGYLQWKITETGYPPKDWIGVHILIWEEHHGPVPAGHAVAFKDGDKRNIVIGNLELVSRQELMRRNSYHNYGKEIAQLVQLRGAITRQLNKRERKSK